MRRIGPPKGALFSDTSKYTEKRNLRKKKAVGGGEPQRPSGDQRAMTERVKRRAD